MRNRHLVAATLCAGIAMSATVHAVTPGPLPKAVKDALDAVAAVCTEVGGTPNTSDAVEAFNGSSFGINLEGTGSSAKRWLSVMGLDCGKQPATSFAGERFCERPLQWNAGTRKFDFAPVSTVKMIQ